MGWFSKCIPWVQGFCTYAVASFTHRIVENISSKPKLEGFTDAEVEGSFDTVKQLEFCDPITNDLDGYKIENICRTLKNCDDSTKARQAINEALTENARPWCGIALKSAATFICTCGPKIVKEATFNLLVC